MVASADKLSKGLPTAQEMMEKLAFAEAAKADEAARRQARGGSREEAVCSTRSPSHPACLTKRR